jgi:inorganic pyrophosphatase
MKIGSTMYVVIETPAGSRNKYKYVPEKKIFKLNKILPEGTSFPADFGFIPDTEGEDGDPLDVLVFMDAPAFPGCIVEVRIIGIIEAEQKEKGEDKVRNDRIIAVATDSLTYSDVKSIKDVNKNRLDEIEHFFEYYCEMDGKKFKMLGTDDKKKAVRLIQKNSNQKVSQE